MALSVYGLAAGALTMFGVMTIVLAAIGIYGLVAYTVQQSTQEIGIRMAVGASRIDVVWDFLRRGTRLAVVGAAIGLVLAVAASGAIRSLLYGVGARDAISFAGGTVVVMTIALLASLFPAWRASKIDPLKALRHQYGRQAAVRNRTSLNPTTSRPLNQAPQLWADFRASNLPVAGMEHAYGHREISWNRSSATCLFAFRGLRRQPAFAITAVLTIALGIGATSAIFSVVNAVMLRPLPYNEAARLGTVWADMRNRNVRGLPDLAR